MNVLPIWVVYYEPADTDKPRRRLGTIPARSKAQALEIGAQFYEIPSHDLVVEREPPAEPQTESRG